MIQIVSDGGKGVKVYQTGVEITDVTSVEIFPITPEGGVKVRIEVLAELDIEVNEENAPVKLLKGQVNSNAS